MSRPRSRDLGLVFGSLESGPLDAIADVGGVQVGSRSAAPSASRGPAGPAPPSASEF